MSANRVISLSPGCTEIVCALGRAGQLAGRSQWCDHPEEILALPVCAGAPVPTEGQFPERLAATAIDRERIASLQPDVILHSIPGGFRWDGGARVVECPAARVYDLWANIQAIADALEVPEPGRELTLGLKNRLVDVISKTCAIETRPAVACVNRLDPLSAAGAWMPELVEFAGGADVFGKAGGQDTPISWAALAKANPDIIVFMPAGLDIEQARRELNFAASSPEWGRLRAIRKRKVFVADARGFFNRPGPRLIDSLEILAEMISPKAFDFGWEGKRWIRL